MMYPDERNAIRAGNWVIDCPKMTLRPCGENTVPISGAGFIRSNENGEISFKLYGTVETRPGVVTFGGRAGTLMSEGQFSTLNVWDSKGREWTAEHVLPFEVWIPELSSVVFSGNVDTLVHRWEYPTQNEPAFLHLSYFLEVEISCNSDTRWEKTVAGSKRFDASTVNAARFTAGDHRFLLEKGDGFLSVETIAPGPVASSNLDLRITEALQFVLAQPLSWTILEHQENGLGQTEIRRLPTPNLRGRLPPPLTISTVDPDGELWILFDRYFSYVIGDTSQKWHRLSHFVHTIIEAGRGSWGAMVLTLGVSVEGVLRLAFANLCEPSPTFKNGIARARQIIAESGLDDEVLKRLQGAFGAIGSFRAQQGLENLLRNGLIRTEELEAWKGLRHKSAHADRLDFVPLQEFIDRAYQLIVLFYRLVFTAIGYEGWYSDYGRKDWPQMRHPRYTTTHVGG